MPELNEQSTTEDVNEFVEELVKETEADRAGTEKPDETLESDSRITSGHADNVKTPVDEDDSVDEAADVEDEGDEVPSWLDDEVRDEAAKYGVEESELSDFASREELDRALRLFDKTALEAGRKAMAEEGDSEPARDDKGQFTPKEEPQAKEGSYEVSLDKDLYDQEIVSEFGRMRDHYEAKVSAVESKLEEVLSHFAEQESVAEEQHFDGLVDSLGHADLFGKSGRENTKQLQRRQDLFVAIKAQRIGLEQLGRPAELDESLVSRVAKMVFAEDLGKKELKSKTRKIQKQSNGRQGGGATRPQDPREDPRDEFDRLYKELEGTT